MHSFLRARNVVLEYVVRDSFFCVVVKDTCRVWKIKMPKTYAMFECLGIDGRTEYYKRVKVCREVSC